MPPESKFVPRLYLPCPLYVDPLCFEVVELKRRRPLHCTRQVQPTLPGGGEAVKWPHTSAPPMSVAPPPAVGPLPVCCSAYSRTTLLQDFFSKAFSSIVAVFVLRSQGPEDQCYGSRPPHDAAVADRLCGSRRGPLIPSMPMVINLNPPFRHSSISATHDGAHNRANVPPSHAPSRLHLIASNLLEGFGPLVLDP